VNHTDNTSCDVGSIVFTAPLHSNGTYATVTCEFVAAGMFLPSQPFPRNGFTCHNILKRYIMSEVLTAVTINTPILRDTALCSPQTFRRNILLLCSGSKSVPSKKPTRS
jgi:hypothetical protein